MYLCSTAEGQTSKLCISLYSMHLQTSTKQCLTRKRLFIDYYFYSIIRIALVRPYSAMAMEVSNLSCQRAETSLAILIVQFSPLQFSVFPVSKCETMYFGIDDPPFPSRGKVGETSDVKTATDIRSLQLVREAYI